MAKPMWVWRYCKHPNYFAEWMVWNGLVIAALPSWFFTAGPGKHHTLAATQRWPAVYFNSDVQHTGV